MFIRIQLTKPSVASLGRCQHKDPWETMPKDIFDRLQEKNITFHWADLVRYEARDDYKKSIGKLGEGLKVAVDLYREDKVKPVIGQKCDATKQELEAALEDLRYGRHKPA